MDSTERHYLTYDPDGIWNAMMAAYVDAGGDVLYPGDEKEMLLRGVMAILVQVYAAHDTAARMRTLRYAAGDYLDLIGETLGTGRIGAAKATARAELVLKGTGTITVPAGTLFTSDGKMFFKNANAIVTIGTGSEITKTIELECAEGGIAGNLYKTGTAMRPTITNATIMSVTLAEDATGGSEKESDDAYRERIRLAGLNSATTGPALAYEEKAAAVSASLLDVNAVRTDAGSVMIYLLFAQGVESEQKTELAADVLAALNAEDERPLTDLVEVEEATGVPYTLNVSYRAPETASENVLTAIAQAAGDYQAWQDGGIGRAFDPYKLLYMLYNAGASRVDITEGSNINGETIAPTDILPGQYLTGTVTLTRDES